MFASPDGLAMGGEQGLKLATEDVLTMRAMARACT